MRFFAPILAGGERRDRVLACLGAGAGIAATGVLCHLLLTPFSLLPLLVAPMGASAVLVFAVPASPLAQPWPVIGGNAVSALVGIAVAALLPDGAVAAGVAVGAAILAMSLLRCLHPPGGAAALTAVIGGPAIHAAGFGFALTVAVDAAVLTLAGLAFHRWSGHSYPHRPPRTGLPDPANRVAAADIERALADADETLDVAPADLLFLFQRAQYHAQMRSTPSPAIDDRS